MRWICEYTLHHACIDCLSYVCNCQLYIIYISISWTGSQNNIDQHARKSDDTESALLEFLGISKLLDIFRIITVSTHSTGMFSVYFSVDFDWSPLRRFCWCCKTQWRCTARGEGRDLVSHRMHVIYILGFARGVLKIHENPGSRPNLSAVLRSPEREKPIENWKTEDFLLHKGFPKIPNVDAKARLKLLVRNFTSTAIRGRFKSNWDESVTIWAT